MRISIQNGDAYQSYHVVRLNNCKDFFLHETIDSLINPQINCVCEYGHFFTFYWNKWLRTMFLFTIENCYKIEIAGIPDTR